VKRFPVITTIPQFCRAVGWPLDALDGVKYTEVLALLECYDLTLDFVFKARKAKEGCGDCGMCASCDARFQEGHGY
jgi:hypothetical protein